MSNTWFCQCLVRKQKWALLNLVFEGSVPALIQMVDEQLQKEKIWIFLPEHSVGILYRPCYNGIKGVIALAR